MRGTAELLFQDKAETGGKLQVRESLRRRVAQYAKEGTNVKKIYVGIASGDSAQQALKRRYDEFKRDEGINEMVAIYKSSSQENCREVEEDLITYFQDHERILNRRTGGGGRTSNGPEYFVYIALRRWG